MQSTKKDISKHPVVNQDECYASGDRHRAGCSGESSKGYPRGFWAAPLHGRRAGFLEHWPRSSGEQACAGNSSHFYIVLCSSRTRTSWRKPTFLLQAWESDSERRMCQETKPIASSKPLGWQLFQKLNKTNPGNPMCWWGYGEIGALSYCCWKSEMAQLWETALSPKQRFNSLACDSGIRYTCEGRAIKGSDSEHMWMLRLHRSRSVKDRN